MSVNVAVQQSVVPDCAEYAICKLSNVHAQVDFYVSHVVRLHSTKLSRRCTSSRMQCSCSGPDTAAHGFQIHKALRVAA